MELVHDLGLGGRVSWLINLDDFEQILSILTEARLLSDRLIASAHLAHFIEVDCTMNKEIPLESFHELAVRFTMMGQNDVWVSSDELHPELSVILTRNFRRFGWILLHLGSPSGKVILHG